MVAAGFVALVALCWVVGALGYLHIAPTGLSPMRNAVSQYGITPYRIGYRVATIAFAVAGVALAVGIDKADPGSTEVVILLGLFAAGRALISWFPMDAPGADRTSTGQAHGLLAIVAFLGIAFAALETGRRLADQATWHSLSRVSTGLGYAMLVTLVLQALSRAHPGLRARFGAIERAFYALAIAWSAVFAIACAANIR